MWQIHTIRDIHGSNNYHKLRGDALPANDAKRERHGKHTGCKQTFGNGEPILTHLWEKAGFQHSVILMAHLSGEADCKWVAHPCECLAQ